MTPQELQKQYYAFKEKRHRSRSNEAKWWLYRINLLLQEHTKEMVSKTEPVKKILEYIATRNDLHNAVCIPKAKEALGILQAIKSFNKE